MATTADGDLKNLAANITPEMLKQLNALANKPSVPPLVTATVVVDHPSPFKIVDVNNAAQEVKKLSDTMERQVDRTDVTKVVLVQMKKLYDEKTTRNAVVQYSVEYDKIISDVRAAAILLKPNMSIYSDKGKEKASVTLESATI